MLICAKRTLLGQITACGYYSFAKERAAEANSAFPVQAMKPNKIKGWQMVQTAPVCQPFALCEAKVYKSPPQRPFPISLSVSLADWLRP